MITVNLKGGLGNQLFQIAAAYSLELEYGKDQFAINYHLPHNLVQGNRKDVYRDNLYRDIPSTDVVPQQIYNEPFFHYQYIPHVSDVMIDGYFQSIKYFQKHLSAVKYMFRFPDSLRSKCDQRLAKIREIFPHLVSVHVRRGDYLRFPTIHPTCSSTYYQSAQGEFSDNVGFVVCSDDHEWCKSNLGHNIILSNGQSDLEDLYILSQCDSAIISNSSFSWWGAVLGNTKQRVFCPEKWFGPEGPQDYQDIYLENWIKRSN